MEFGLVVPLFFLMFFGVIQLGLMLGGQNALVGAVRETARYASTYRVVTASDAAAACVQVQDFLLSDRKGLHQIPGFEDGRVTSDAVTYSWVPNPDSTYFVQIRVTASYSFPLYVPIVGNILDNAAPHQSAKLSAQEEMRIENEGLQVNPGDVSC